MTGLDSGPSDEKLAHKIHMLLLDPVEVGTNDAGAPDQPTLCFKAVYMGVASVQLIAAAYVIVTYIDMSEYNHVCKRWAALYYFMTAFLSCFSAIPACGYAWIATRKRRPQFVHRAGWYLFANTMSFATLNLYLHGECKRTALWRNMFIPHVLFAFVCYSLLQVAILKKVEALWSTGVPSLRALLRAAIIPAATLFVLHAGVNTKHLPLSALYFEVFFILALMMILMIFTMLAVRKMLRCRDLLSTSALPSDLRRKHRWTLMVHAVATAVANGSSALFLTMGLLFALNVAKTRKAENNAFGMFVLSHGFDTVFNVICMVLLSGLSSSLCGGGDDVIVKISDAGHAAQGTPPSTSYGRRAFELDDL